MTCAYAGDSNQPSSNCDPCFVATSWRFIMPHPIGLLLQHPLAQIPTACSSPIHLVALSSWSVTPDTTTYGSGREISQLVLTNSRRLSDRVMLWMTSFYVFRWRNKLQPSWRTHPGESHSLTINYATIPSISIRTICNTTSSILRFIYRASTQLFSAFKWDSWLLQYGRLHLAVHLIIQMRFMCRGQ